MGRPKTVESEDFYRDFPEEFTQADFERLQRMLDLWQAKAKSATSLFKAHKKKKASIQKIKTLNLTIKKIGSVFRSLEESVQA